MSDAQLKEYLSLLMEYSLLDAASAKVEAVVMKNIYRITEKGLRLLQVFSEINSLTGPGKFS